MFETLPFNYEAESSVLGSILLQPELLNECYLDHDEFHDERHQLIMKFIRYLSDIGKPVDLVSIATVAGNQNERLGGITYLSDLASSVPTVENFGYYQEAVRKTHIKRKAIATLTEKARDGFKTDNPSETITEVQNALESLLNLSSGSRKVSKMSDALKHHEEVIHKRSEQKGLTGTKTVSIYLDKMTNGHQKQDLIIVGARPSIGKTAFMLNDAIRGLQDAKEKGINTAAAVVFSLEMTAEKIAERAACIIGNIDSEKMRSGTFEDKDWERWRWAVSEMENMPLFIDDTPGITLSDMERKVKQLKKDFPDLVVYVDYLQEVKGGKKFNSDYDETTYVSNGLKQQIARRNDVPVIALSSVSRKCEQRQDKRPMMSDLRESGNIEFDADIIIFLYRDDYYNAETDKKSIMEIIVAKGRNVGTGLVEMINLKKSFRLVDIKTKEETSK